MDLPNFHFRLNTEEHFSLPMSAFSTYNLLKNCNSVLASQTQDSRIKYFLNPETQSKFPYSEPDKQFRDTKNPSPNPAIFRYSPTLSFLPDQLQTKIPQQYSSYESLKLRRQRGEKRPIPDEQKDERYYEKRRRNNQAAKKSRDARKFREDQIALRAAILEHENAIMRAQILTLREETASLRQMLLQKKSIEIVSRDPQLCVS
ncbi:unnamed protein product [Phyllotreta striolata]|uniref:BZIP domain-containing protein n=1 Tax=Phyllotreta striolata TaxID=444603 RepID=A0A9N9TYF1_PHYSR|nr:unnamed protein product [Phyllotreta striolata]